MNTRSFLKLAGIVALVTGVVIATRPRPTESQAGPAPTSARRQGPSPRPASAHAAQEAAHSAAELKAARERVRETTKLMKEELLPLLEKMPKELERAQALIQTNDSLFKEIDAMAPPEP